MSKSIDGLNHWERSRPSTNPCSNCDYRGFNLGEPVCFEPINYGGNPMPLPKNPKVCPQGYVCELGDKEEKK